MGADDRIPRVCHNLSKYHLSPEILIAETKDVDEQKERAKPKENARLPFFRLCSIFYLRETSSMYRRISAAEKEIRDVIEKVELIKFKGMACESKKGINNVVFSL